jgi:hypothetical protein
MKEQWDNKVLSSTLLWLDNTLLSDGEAFFNTGHNFYPIRSEYNGFYSYGLPFKQIVADASISGAIIMTGVYLNSNFITTGQSGLLDISYEHGQVYFNSDVGTALSGSFAVKEFNVSITELSEAELLFETKYQERPKTIQTATGLAPNVLTFPSVFLRNQASLNEPIAFGGQDITTLNVRAIVLADSQFNLDAVCSLLRDKVRTHIPIVEGSEMPFNAIGGYAGAVYNYTGLVANKEVSDQLFISRVDISRLGSQNAAMTELKKINPKVYPAIIDFELEAFRYPRLN